MGKQNAIKKKALVNQSDKEYLMVFGILNKIHKFFKKIMFSILLNPP